MCLQKLNEEANATSQQVYFTWMILMVAYNDFLNVECNFEANSKFTHYLS